MALEAVFVDLLTRFGAMREALQSLGLTVIEDRPARDDVLLVERLGNRVEDLRGWLEEAYTAALKAREAVAHPADLHEAREALGAANEQFLLLEYDFHGAAVAHDTIEALLDLGRHRGREWLGWSRSVVQALDACRGPLRALDEALIQAWRELGERLGARSWSLRTTNIGQQISAAPAAERVAPPAPPAAFAGE